MSEIAAESTADPHEHWEGSDRPAPSSSLTLVPHHLRRIADQIEAANLLQPLAETSDALGIAAATDLTPRQWEVVSRLLQGQRVPRIAADLYLSPSTVRNHLSAVFARTGVRSQEELVALYRRWVEEGSAGDRAVGKQRRRATGSAASDRQGGLG
ncbi:MAG: response regulator transcription factor [Acidimicrobiales bacterium]